MGRLRTRGKGLFQGHRGHSGKASLWVLRPVLSGAPHSGTRTLRLPDPKKETVPETAAVPLETGSRTRAPAGRRARGAQSGRCARRCGVSIMPSQAAIRSAPSVSNARSETHAREDGAGHVYLLVSNWESFHHPFSAPEDGGGL